MPMGSRLRPGFGCKQLHQYSISRSASNHTRPSQGDGGIAQEQAGKKVRVRKAKRMKVFSGIQPTGIPHLGNYLGALRQWKELQDGRASSKPTCDLTFCIVDQHAITQFQEPAELRRQKHDTLASLLAIGLTKDHSMIYFQSEVPGHLQLMWYLSSLASTGYLSRMTQWKSKLGVSEDATIDDHAAREKLRLGLFSYPVLQAADILLNRCDTIPVGEDQLQHIEFTRALARSFNTRYKEYNDGRDFFEIPKAMVSPAKRIMSLKDPTAKMSKSDHDPNSRILITDSPDEIQAKIKGALTDSINGITYDPETRPGVSNLISILKHVSKTEASPTEIAADIHNLSMREFKEHVAKNIIASLDGIRDRFMELSQPNTVLEDTLQAGREIVSARTGHTMRAVEGLMGLREQRAPQGKVRGSNKEEKELAM